MKTPILEVRGVTKSFPGVRALKGVDLTIYPGEVHALVGENGAGKSTLMKILAGAQRADGGEIKLEGKPVNFLTPHEARVAGVGIIYQELTIAPNLTVAQNIFLGSEERRMKILANKPNMVRRAQEVVDRLGASMKAGGRASRLSIAKQQQVEIARALFHKSRILVMDEPTTALSDRETDRLFDIINQLRNEGMAIIYISHRMAEIYKLADRITVFRDGAYVGELLRKDFSSERVIEMMVGRKLEELYKHADCSTSEVVMEVRNMSDGDMVHDASFKLHRGEVLGLAGLVGAGRTELARLIFGADKRTGGELLLEGKKVKINKPTDAIAAGIGYVPEDRKLQGLFLQMSCQDNMVMNILQRCAHLGILNSKATTERAENVSKILSLRAASLAARAGGLSGGNQQKLLVGRWLEIQPKVLILDEPTRGVDIGAKAEMYTIIQGLAQQGMSVLFISSELPEIIGVCQRVLVMREGHIMGEVGGTSGEEITQENIMRLATGLVKAA